MFFKFCFNKIIFRINALKLVSYLHYVNMNVAGFPQTQLRQCCDCSCVRLFVCSYQQHGQVSVIKA